MFQVRIEGLQYGPQHLSHTLLKLEDDDCRKQLYIINILIMPTILNKLPYGLQLLELWCFQQRKKTLKNWIILE